METTRTKPIGPTLHLILKLVSAGDVKISAQGYDGLSSSALTIQDVFETISGAIVLEDYPLFPKGPCVLVLQKDSHGQPVHVVWGIPKGHPGPAVLVTAYRPDDTRWDEGFTRRKR